VWALLVLIAGAVQLSAQQSETARKHFEDTKAKAERGDAIAQLNLGFSYENGDGVVKDVVEAVKRYRKAADQNYAPAQCYLGACYENGLDVSKDEAEAVKWYRKAAEQNPAERVFRYR
jgi:hypothetical protein